MDMLPIMNVFNEWHAANTSKIIKAVIEANCKAGKYRTTFAPYGYVKGDDENHLPVVDEYAADRPRDIHIYYKLLEKPLPHKKYLVVDKSEESA